MIPGDIIGLLAPLLPEFSLIQQSKFTSHIHGEILGLVLDKDPSVNPALWI